ncbi:hypothetical protein, conserved [Plasmodium vivax]|uniref:Rhoptry associated adhesin n=2 Tax=Plasmodium vivax TaxID=5855 RepID=A5K7E7_PLAVS|nr:hypothetical protein, conserved [Plasmodium vivax]EDL44706.1 hypothetical protein, conserved [Plasmodium vivax]SCO66839.1 conserved Plasmodium protein, unknown function [Plasmodium vivax]|eukprot:XP_001614433.1 hypothetical protein [Plasmodium vivax Sal-1]
MKKLLLLFLICSFKIWAENTRASKFANSKRKRNGNAMRENKLNNDDVDHYSFLSLRTANEEKAATENDSNNAKKEGEENTNGNEKKNEENGSGNEKRNEENNANEKKNEQTNDQSNGQSNSQTNIPKKNEAVPPEKKINKENLLEYGTHDKDGHFIPSYKTLTDEILSTNNSLERASSFLKIACSHIMKIVEFIPESKLSSQYIKVESKNVYIKDITSECQNIFFSLEKLTMTMIVLNSKMNKLVYVQDK